MAERSATAGDGDIKQVDDHIEVELNVHLGFPPDQDDIDLAEAELRKVAGAICDATDGVVRIKKIRLGDGAYSEYGADVVWCAAGALTRSGGSSTVLFGETENLATIEYSKMKASTVTHELGHSLLGLVDQYDEQRRWGGACGIGQSFDPDTFTNPEDGANHTILQTYSIVECSSEAQGASNYVACDDDGDCQGYLDTPICAPWAPVRSSELNVESNFDLLRGDDSWYGEARPANQLVLSGLLQEEETIGEFDPDDPEGTTVLMKKFELFDEAGDISKGQGKLSSHLVHLFVSHDDTALWTLHFAIDGGDLNDGVEGVWTIFGTVELEFDLTDPQGPEEDEYPLLKVNGEDYIGIAPTITLENLVNTDLESELSIAVGDMWHTTETAGYSVVDPIYPLELQNVKGGDKYNNYFQFLHDGGRQLGDCNQAFIEKLWNETTQRFEGSDQLRRALAEIDAHPEAEEEIGEGDDWHLMTWRFKERTAGKPEAEKLLVQSEIPADLPVVAPGALCEGVYDDVVIENNLEAANRVYIVFDTSGSMVQEANNLGDVRTKLAWSKAAAQAYVDYVVDDGVDEDGVELGLISFDSSATVEQSALRVVSSNAGQGEILKTTYKDLIDTLDADGLTNLGDALLVAKDEIESFDDDAGAVMLLSDGKQTTGDVTPQDAADELWGANPSIPIMVTPIGDFPKEDLEELSSITKASTFAAREAVEIPEAFLEMFATYRGEQVVLREVSEPLGANETQMIEIAVEEEADQLTLLLTNLNDSLGAWPLQFDLDGPQSEHLTETDTQYVSTSTHNHLKTITLDDPSPGIWELTLAAPSGAPEQTTSVMAHVKNAAPDCWVGVTRDTVTDSWDEVEVHASASWQGAAIISGVTYEVEVHRPNGSVVALTLEASDDGRGAMGKFTDFAGRGQYDVVMRCVVEEGAVVAPTDEGEPVEGPLDEVPGFTRRSRDSFYADLSTFTVTPGGDCDGDGFTDSLEGSTSVDTDGDGVPDLCDSDSDGDDLPDGVEGTGDTDSDGTLDRLDTDSDDDGDVDGADLAPVDAAWNRYARGDFDNDGRVDRVRGEPSYASSKGRIVVDYGDGDSQSLNRDTADVDDTSYAGDEFGSSVAVGDFNDDGWDDLAVGVPGDDVNSIDAAGSIHVLYGSSTGLSANGDQVWHQDSSGVQGTAEAGDRFGTRLTTGDFDGDGAADVAIGSPDEAVGSYADAGAVNVLYGGVGGVSSVDDLWYQGTDGVNDTAEGGDRFGDALASGDFDGDDYQDLVIGAPDEDYSTTNSAGYVYAIYGTTDGLSTTGDFGFFQSSSGWADTSEASDRLGARFWIDDRDGDGYDDLTVFVPGDGCGAGTHGYQVVYGDSGGLSSSGNAIECLEGYQQHE